MDNKELQGVMFPNDKMTDRQPDFRGSVKIGGLDYYISAWKRVSKAGGQYLSLAFTKKEPKQTPAAAHTPKETVEQVSQAVGGKTDFENVFDDEPLPF